MSALAALVAATWLHAGFQLSVSVLVYPALLAPGGDWSARHAVHSRRIAPVVGLVYGALVVGSAWVLAVGPVTGWVLGAVGSAALAVLATALVAAPAHGRLAAGRDPRVERRLTLADRTRLVAGVVAAVASALAVLLR